MADNKLTRIIDRQIGIAKASFAPTTMTRIDQNNGNLVVAATAKPDTDGGITAQATLRNGIEQSAIIANYIIREDDPVFIIGGRIFQ